MSGGDIETIGAGYGPGIGEFYERVAMVISRASGEHVVQNAIQFAAQLVRGKLRKVANTEFQNAKKSWLI